MLPPMIEFDLEKDQETQEERPVFRSQQGGKKFVLHISKISSLNEERIQELTETLAGCAIFGIGALVVSGVTSSGDERSYLKASQTLSLIREKFSVEEEQLILLPSMRDTLSLDLFSQFFFLPNKRQHFDPHDVQIVTLSHTASSDQVLQAQPYLQIIGCNALQESGTVGITTKQVEGWHKKHQELHDTGHDQHLQRLLVTNAPIGQWATWHQDTIFNWRERNHLVELTIAEKEECRRTVPQIVTEPGRVQLLQMNEDQHFLHIKAHVSTRGLAREILSFQLLIIEAVGRSIFPQRTQRDQSILSYL